MHLGNNRISNISSLATSRINYVREMSLRENQIEQLPAEVFQNLNVLYALDLSFNNKLSSIPDGAFSGLKQLEVLFLHFNNISKISSLTFAGLRNLRMLMLVNNSLASLPEKAFAEMSLSFLFLHGNRIKNIDANAFRGLTDLRLVTLFENPALMSLPRNVFNGLTENVTLVVSCKTLKELPRGINEARVVCAPTESLFVIVSYRERRYQRDGLLASGFMCPKCRKEVYPRCLNCSLCSTGTYSSRDTTNTHCLKCPAGGFYQDEMGQIDCKNCSIGTYVPEINYPGKSATDCRACPYGVCEDVCFTKDGSDCISLLKADYSISCHSPANGVYWKLAAACAIYPLLFPLLLLIPLYKYREPRLDDEICFGLKVFFENYKEKYWFWEIIEMYRKLILISGILLFDSTSQYQIVCAVIVASVSGITYSMARPIKGKFEDRLQAFVLWTIFFNVCLGAITMCQNPIENESMFVNVIFVLLNSAVVLIAVVEGLLNSKSNWRNFSSCPVRCFRMMYGRCRDGHGNRRSDLSLIQPLTEEPLVFDE
nr:uncharacterized protein LOC131772642 isoform X3 [Pocillopora verrucosa]